MDWKAAPVTSMGVWELPFSVTRDGDEIPGILWMPEEPTGRVPLVLMGHGGQSEKRNENGLALARKFVRRHGIAVAAIDAVVARFGRIDSLVTVATAGGEGIVHLAGLAPEAELAGANVPGDALGTRADAGEFPIGIDGLRAGLKIEALGPGGPDARGRRRR